MQRDDDLIAKAKNLAASPMGKDMAVYGGIGAVAAFVLPFVSWPAGLIIGGAAAWAKHRKR
jgi:hypothetical protein